MYNGLNGPVVQLAEPTAHNCVVAGSSPAGPTIKKNQIFIIFKPIKPSFIFTLISNIDLFLLFNES